MTTQTNRKPIESHDTHSKRLFQHALEQLAKGDRLQATEKAWGAVAHRVKAIARQRGWNYNTHTQFHDLRWRIASLTDDPDKTDTLLDKASGLHGNYYRDTRNLDVLKRDLDKVKELLDILDGPPFRTPSRPKRRKKQPRRRGGGSKIGGMVRPIVKPKKHRAERSHPPEDKPPTQSSLDKGKR